MHDRAHSPVNTHMLVLDQYSFEGGGESPVPTLNTALQKRAKLWLPYKTSVMTINVS